MFNWISNKNNNNKSNLSKIVSFSTWRNVKKKTFWMRCNLTKRLYLGCRKHRCHKSQSISKYSFLLKHLSFKRKFINQFKNLNIAIKLARRQIKDSCYSEAATKSHIGILRIFFKISEKWNSYFEENLFNQNTSSGCFCLRQQFPKKQKK